MYKLIFTRYFPENSDKNVMTETNVYHGNSNNARISIAGLTHVVDEMDRNNGTSSHSSHSDVRSSSSSSSVHGLDEFGSTWIELVEEEVPDITHAEEE